MPPRASSTIVILTSWLVGVKLGQDESVSRMRGGRLLRKDEWARSEMLPDKTLMCVRERHQGDLELELQAKEIHTWQ